MEKCKNFNKNKVKCNCSYEPCPRKGFCCECVDYHRENRELPACFFSSSFESTYDRSFSNFVAMLKDRK